MRHRAVAVPEADTARAQVLEHMADSGQDCLRRARDDAVRLLKLAIRVVGVLEAFSGVQRQPAVLLRLNLAGPARLFHVTHAGRRQQSPTVDHARQILDMTLDVAARTLEEDVARTGQILAPDLLGQFLGLVDVHFPEVATVLRASLVAEFGCDLVVVSEGIARWRQPRREHHVGVAMLGGPGHGSL